MPEKPYFSVKKWYNIGKKGGMEMLKEITQITMDLSPYQGLYEAIIPQYHILRKLKENIDFSFVNPMLRKQYCENFGCPAKEPEMMFKLLFLCAAFGMAENYGVAITPVWMLTAFIISIVLAIAAPPVPGAALTCYTILFIQLGIPSEAVAVVITLNVILEFVTTAVNLFCLQTELVELSGSLKVLDTDCLRNR